MTRAYNQYQQKNAAKDQEKEDTRFADSVDVYKRQDLTIWIILLKLLRIN